MEGKDKYYNKMALFISSKLGGKLTIAPTTKIKSEKDISILYTPGSAAVAKEIVKDPLSSYKLTWRWNTIFIVTNGTRVLGLGDIGPLASLPVMEGKALLYKTYGGINAIPIPIKSTDVEEFVKIIDALSVTAGGIHLEDISSPFCFEVLEKLQEKLSIPVWHDDQQGTAGATLAGLINAFKLVGKDLKKARMVLVGAGAANIALFNLLEAYGVDLGNVIVGDSKGPLNKNRADIEEMKVSNRWKYQISEKSNRSEISGINESFDDADAIIGFSAAGTIKPGWIKRMSDKPIVFANANPTPEISPKLAKKAGAYIISTARPDYPNQINNSLIFPGLFRGVLDSRTRFIDNKLIIAAAETLAALAEKQGISKDNILPKTNQKEVHIRVAAAVAEYSSRTGNSMLKGDFRFFYNLAKENIVKGKHFADSG
jgi:malate dehydrogenase (oxaloacetate-decarboxylating)/malate dehydrogenase (oxaloacetate-decarboxylating)(NADP+)